MHSINRLFFLSLGSVCFLIVPFFWLALAFDFSALENFVIALSHAELVGYPIPELLGSAKGDTVVDKVWRIEIVFTIIAIAYSLFFVALSYLEVTRKRVNYCARGLAIPLFLLILGFWIKFIGDDHIISKEEKTELFKYTTTCFVISALLFTYSFRSEKKVKPEEVVADAENDADGDKELTPKESDSSAAPEEDALPPPDGHPADASADAPAPDSGESDLLPAPEEDALPTPDGDPADTVADAPAPDSVESDLLPAPEEDALPPPDAAPADTVADAPESVESEPLPPPESNENEEGVPEDSSSESELLENLGLDKTQPIPPATDRGAASSEADDPPDESQEETDTSPKIVDEDADDSKPQPS